MKTMLASGRCRAHEAADQILAAGWTYGVTPGMDDASGRCTVAKETVFSRYRIACRKHALMLDWLDHRDGSLQLGRAAGDVGDVACTYELFGQYEDWERCAVEAWRIGAQALGGYE